MSSKNDDIPSTKIFVEENASEKVQNVMKNDEIPSTKIFVEQNVTEN